MVVNNDKAAEIIQESLSNMCILTKTFGPASKIFVMTHWKPFKPQRCVKHYAFTIHTFCTVQHIRI